MTKFQLVLGIHGHQPVGNFPEVFEDLYARAYAPFVKVLGEFPGVPCVAHYSGVLFDWFEAHHPEFLDRLAVLVDRGQVELLTGGYYEPILAAIPDADKLGQIARLSEYLERRFGTRPRGIWLAERVWEPHLAKPLVEAGVEYVLLDDNHFLAAGLPDEALTGYFLTEEQGASLAVFPISQRLRYLVPFHEPPETIGYLRDRARLAPQGVAVVVDDAEKFGGWPGTHERVYRKGWLRRFLEAVQSEAHWLQPVPLSHVLRRDARGTVYLPTACYTEMMEWALPVEAREAYDAVLAEVRRRGEDRGGRPFVRGGFWRNFLAKYPEANTLHRRMLRASRRVHALPVNSPARPMALRELWKGQCNDVYWHGTFGGVYLPHLRHAAYSHLIRAETLVDAAHRDAKPSLRITEEDLEGTGRRLVRVETPLLGVTWDPELGGSLIALEHRGKAFNLGNTMTRRPEAYHRRTLEARRGVARLRAAAGAWRDRLIGTARRLWTDEGTVSSRPPGLNGLARLLEYDRHRRAGFQDHWVPPGYGLPDFARGRPIPADELPILPYRLRLEAGEESASLNLKADTGHGSVEKQFQVHAGSASVGSVYLLSDFAWDTRRRFGTELNLAMLMGGPPDRYVEVNGLRPPEGSLFAVSEHARVQEFRLVDRWLGLAARLRFDPPCTIWRAPVQTVTFSETGFDVIPQQVALLALWEVPDQSSAISSISMDLAIEAWEAEADQVALAATGARGSGDE